MRGISSIAKAAAPDCQRLDRVAMPVRVHRGENKRAALDRAELALGRASHFEEKVSLGENLAGLGKASSGGLIVCVGYARLEAGAVLNRDFCAEADEFLDRLGRGRDARFRRIDFSDNPNEHGSHPKGMRRRR